MKHLIVRIIIAAPISLALLLSPFLIAHLVHDRVTIPAALSAGVGIALALAVFFSIAGKQMKQVDKEWNERRGKAS